MVKHINNSKRCTTSANNLKLLFNKQLELLNIQFCGKKRLFQPMMAISAIYSHANTFIEKIEFNLLSIIPNFAAQNTGR